jgi:hypothetical protein
MAFMPPFAPIVVLAFLGSAALVALLGAVLLYGLIARRATAARLAALGVVLVVLGYAGLLLGDSIWMPERTLLPGRWKYFCEIDCHLAYSVARVETADELGPTASSVRARGRFVVVTLRTWFDEGTISPRRGDSPLEPNPRVVFLEDATRGRWYPSAAGAAALTASGRASTPLTRPLRPGESYETLLAFDMPRGSEAKRLFVGDAPGIEFLLIGHENSPLHRKVYLGFPS